MKRFFQSGSFKNLLVIAAVIFAGVVFAAISHNASSPISSVVGTVFYPLNSLSDIISENLTDVSASFKSSSVYKSEVEELEAELQEYRKKLAGYDEMKQKVDAYEEFLDIKEKNEDYEFCYASIVSKDAADAYGSFVLNVGSGDNVSVGDPVIYGEYVVGIVKKVGFSTCVVYSVFDPRIDVGVYETGTKEYGYLSGDAQLYNDGLCKFNGLKASTSVVSGGMVCTSGAGGVFPSDLLVGEVVSVISDEISSAYYAEVKPFCSVEDIADVFVITSFEGQGESGVE